MQITHDYMELTPAYGRDYKTKAQVIEAFVSGKDFQGDYSIRFQLTSIRDFKPGTKVLLRYRKNTMVTAFVVPAQAMPSVA